MAQPTSKPVAPQPVSGGWFDRLTLLAFLLSLTLVIVRATLTETLREPFGTPPDTPRAPGPATSLLLDLVACLPALLVLARRVFDRTCVLQLNLSHALMGGLALWMAMSVTWASDRFAAMVHAANFIAALALLWALTQLVRSWGRLRLVAAVALGLLLVYVAAGLEYRFIDLPQDRAYFQANREQLLRERQLVEGTPAAIRFEQKVLRGDIGRFSDSPNTYAAAIVLMTLISGGLVIQRFAGRDPVGWTLPIIVALPLAIYVLLFTHSRTAIGTLLIGSLALPIIGRFRGWMAARGRPLYWAAAVAFVLGWAALIGHGLYHGTLGEKSLTFRWYYWTGGMRMLAEHPPTGVGWANFGSWYPKVRAPLAVEEVQDPHNFIVKALAELGIVGGVLMLAWIGRMIWEATVVAQVPEETPARYRVGGLAGLACAPLILSFLVGTDFSQRTEWVLLQALRAGFGAMLLSAGLIVASMRQLLGEERYDDRPSPWVRYGLLIGLGCFFLHNLLDFAWFETGPMFIVAMLLGSVLGATSPSGGGRRNRLTPLLALTVCVVMWGLAAGFVWGRTALAETLAATADETMHAGRPAAKGYMAAMAAQPLNADYAFRAAHAMAAERMPPAAVHGLLDAAIRANPAAIPYRITKAEYEMTLPQPDAATVETAYQEAIALDPQAFRMRIRFADALMKLGNLRGAIEQYRKALAQSDALPADESKRLADTERREIELRLQRPRENK